MSITTDETNGHMDIRAAAVRLAEWREPEAIGVNVTIPRLFEPCASGQHHRCACSFEKFGTRHSCTCFCHKPILRVPA